MRKFITKTIKDYVTKEFFQLLFFFIMFLIVFILAELVFFDKGKIDLVYGGEINMPDWDYYVANVFLFDPNYQGYVLVFCFIILTLLVFFFLESYISSRRDEENVAMLILKGFSFRYSSGLFLFIKLGLVFIAACLSIAFGSVLNVIINSALHMKMPIFVINGPTIILFVTIYGVFSLINIVSTIINYKPSKLIQITRELY